MLQIKSELWIITPQAARFILCTLTGSLIFFGDTWHIRIDWYAVTFDINLGILEETDML